MTAPGTTPAEGATRLADLLRAAPAAEDAAPLLPDAVLQALLGQLVRAYSRRVLSGGALPPFAAGDGVTATDVVILARAMLKAADLAPFELAMWEI